jgi:hypothetical protein
MRIVDQPESVFYKYSPKCVSLQFTVEALVLPENCRVDVYYESLDPETVTPLLVTSPIMESLVMDRNLENTILTCRCRLNDISKNHMRRRFVFGVSFPEDESLPRLFTTSIDMRSKQVRPRKRKREQSTTTTTVQQLPPVAVVVEKKKRSLREIVLNMETILLENNQSKCDATPPPQF